MAKIRHIKIKNFRSIKHFEWWPNPGVNCLIGPGDSGKSTVIDAIDLCLGPRRTKEFADSDFHKLNTEESILIEITVSDLADTLKNLDKYDLFLRGVKPDKKVVEDEPGVGFEVALTVVLYVGSDLDPQWSLYSERAATAGVEKSLTWGDRVLLAGTRIDAANQFHLSWRKGSVLDRLSDEKPDTATKIADAKRAAREAFSDIADDQLDETLEQVKKIAETLGVDLEVELQALLSAHSISLSGGTIAVHDADGIPLSRLGLGSTRLLVAGLLNAAQDGSDLVLVDELEHGLEPHRIIRFLGALGAKEDESSKQAFFTSHSPIVLRELNAEQLFVLKKGEGEHQALCAAIDAHSQGAVRSQPEAFLAKRVLLCEGASEVGLIRGIELHRSEQGEKSLFGAGLNLLNAGGCSRLYERSPTLQLLGYECASFRDDDVEADLGQEATFQANGGTVFKWQPGQKVEAAIIHGLPASQLLQFVERAVNLHGEELIDQHLNEKSGGALSVAGFRAVPDGATITVEQRDQLVDACSGKKNPWFKNVGAMEELTKRVIAPVLDDCDEAFKSVIDNIQAWALDG
tara:strand:+ start:1752 stop:3473 length:1722 start_codon:yes stop_codon:yes gene_type:complete